MKTRAMLLVLAAGWAVAAAAAEPRCPIIPMGAITGRPDEQTEPFQLEVGEHLLAIEAGGSDANYFLPVAWVFEVAHSRIRQNSGHWRRSPAGRWGPNSGGFGYFRAKRATSRAWVAGDFAVENGAIKALPRTVGAGDLWKHGLADFAGQLPNTTQVDIPSHAADVKLRINTGGLYTSVTLDGEAMGERAWAPFEWAVPAGSCGKTAELKIGVWSSVAPLFGDWKNPAAAWKREFWVPPPEPRSDIGILSFPEWVLS